MAICDIMYNNKNKIIIITRNSINLIKLDIGGNFYAWLLVNENVEIW